MDREKHIVGRLEKHYNHIESLGYEIVGIFAQGSMNYNLDIYDDDYMSDIDSKCLIIPTLTDLIKGNKMVSTKYDFEGEQIDVKDIRVMMEMWKKQNQSYLEILFSDFYIINPIYEDYMENIIGMSDDIVKMNEPQLIRCILGMAKEKLVALKHPYPATIEKIEKFGYDPKQFHHIIRLCHLASNIFNNKLAFKESMIYNKDDRLYDYMIKAKKGTFSLEFAEDMSKKYIKDIEDIRDKIITKQGKDNFQKDIYIKLEDSIYELTYYGIHNMIFLNTLEIDDNIIDAINNCKSDGILAKDIEEALIKSERKDDK